jgi:hypothetical protein
VPDPVSTWTVRAKKIVRSLQARHAGAELGPYARSVTGGDIRNRDWVAALLASQTTITAIAEAAEVSRQTARTWIVRHGLGKEPARTRPSPARLARLYDRHRATTRVAEDLGVSSDTARRWLIDAGIDLASAGRPRVVLDLEVLRVRQQSGETLRALAAEAGVSAQTLRRRLPKS